MICTLCLNKRHWCSTL